MGTYTLRLSEVVDVLGGTTEIVDGIRVLDKPEILRLDSYPLHESRDRTELNGLILDRFWNEEIAHESVEIFKNRLRHTLFTIMPPINELYASLQLEFNPLSTIDMRTTGKSEGENNSTSKSLSKADTVNTNEGRVTNLDLPSQQLRADADHAESGTVSKGIGSTLGTSDTDSEGSDTSRGESNSHTVGYGGSPASLLMEYRESIINVDPLVLDGLTPLFMQLWGSPHPLTANPYWM